MRLFCQSFIGLLFLGFVAHAHADELVGDGVEFEEQAIQMAVNRSYPGGLDEDDLSVQPEITFAKPHLTAATLQWRTLNAINRANASQEKPNPASAD